MVRTDGHVAVASSKALSLGGVGHDTPSPFGGLVERKDNELTGLLAEAGRERVAAVIPALTLEDRVQALEDGGRGLLT